MYIAAAAEGDSLQDSVSDEFASCNYLLIINVDIMDVHSIKNTDYPKGEYLAHKVAEYNCEAVITGKLTPKAFDVLANEDITRYDGHGYAVKDALILMEQRGLKLIRNVRETDECESRHLWNGS